MDDQVSLIYTDQVFALPADQVAALTTDQVAALSPATSTNYNSLSNSQLDAAYAAAYNAQDWTTTQAIAPIITSRLATPGAFLGGLFGANSFPLYQNIVNGINSSSNYTFTQSGAAQSSVAQASSNVAATAGNAVASAASFAQGSLALIAVIVVGGLILFHSAKE